MRSYRCGPPSPRQPGGIADAGGVLRRGVPRRATPGHDADADLDASLRAFNTRPRKGLGSRTPPQAFARHLGAALGR